jgi:hypothetical protein
MRLRSIFASATLFVVCGILAAQTPPALQPPSQIHFHGPMHSMTLYWDGTKYLSKTETGVISVWTVEKFTPEAVSIRRFETGFEAVYKGEISSDGKSLVNVTMNGGPAYGATFTWDSAIISPRSDAERDGTKANGGNPASIPTPPVVPATTKSQVSAAAPDGAKATAMPSQTAARQNSGGSLPDVMHFCAINCMALTLTNGQYITSYIDVASGFIVTGIWTVEKFSSKSVIFNRKDSTGFAAVFKGKISSDGNRLVDITMNGAPVRGAILTWGDALNSIPSSNATQDQLAKNLQDESKPMQPGDLPHNPLVDAAVAVITDYQKPHPENIIMPPGAAPGYASFPSEMRAIIRQSASLPPGGDTAACKDAAKFTDEQAMEISKFAYRAMDFDRANCWMKLLVDKGYIRASVIFAAAKAMGWGMPRDLEGAFATFQYAWDSKRDPWADYMLAQCYDNGYGTAVNKAAAAHLNVVLMSSPVGQQVIMADGADDRRMLSNFNNFQNIFYPKSQPVEEYRRECDELLGCHPVKVEKPE